MALIFVRDGQLQLLAPQFPLYKVCRVWSKLTPHFVLWLCFVNYTLFSCSTTENHCSSQSCFWQDALITTAIRENSSYRIWLSIHRLAFPAFSSLVPRFPVSHFESYRLRRVVNIILFLGTAYKFSYLLTYLLNTKSRSSAVEPK